VSEYLFVDIFERFKILTVAVPVLIKDLRNSLQLSQLEMSELLGISYSFYTMAEGGNRTLPGHATIRVLEINQLLAKREPAKKEITESDRNFLIEELKSMASAAGLAQKRRVKKENDETRSSTAGEMLGYLLSHFDLLAENSTDPEQDRIWKGAMESKVREPHSPGKAQLIAIQNRIEAECQALRIRLIQEELESVQKSA
jgi:transcriptional regulator with XRE-family HTH domain